jgi:hypothetical protein
MKEQKKKGKWDYTTFWMLLPDGWQCAKNSKDFNANKSAASALEKRTSHWHGSMYLGTTTEKIQHKPKKKKRKRK